MLYYTKLHDACQAVEYSKVKYSKVVQLALQCTVYSVFYRAKASSFSTAIKFWRGYQVTELKLHSPEWRKFFLFFFDGKQVLNMMAGIEWWLWCKGASEYFDGREQVMTFMAGLLEGSSVGDGQILNLIQPSSWTRIKRIVIWGCQIQMEGKGHKGTKRRQCKPGSPSCGTSLKSLWFPWQDK